MKLSFLAITTLATVVVAQNATSPKPECGRCIQTRLQEQPGCTGVVYNLENKPDVKNAMAFLNCWCTVDASFMDSCGSDAVCGSDVSTYKASFKESVAAMPCKDIKDIHASSASTQLVAPMAASLVAFAASMAFQLL